MAEYWTTQDIVEEAERRGLVVAQRTVQFWCKTGQLDAFKLGRDWLICEEAAQDLLSKMAEVSGDDSP